MVNEIKYDQAISGAEKRLIYLENFLDSTTEFLGENPEQVIALEPLLRFVFHVVISEIMDDLRSKTQISIGQFATKHESSICL